MGIAEAAQVGLPGTLTFPAATAVEVSCFVLTLLYLSLTFGPVGVRGD